MKDKMDIRDIYSKLLPSFTKKYIFRSVEEHEYLMVKDFINRFWKKNHVLAKSKALLDWQHFDKDKKKYNFNVAIENNSNEIHALEGFIPSSQFDKNILNPIVWTAIWKSRDDIIVPPGLGMMIHWYGVVNLKYIAIAALGISDIAFPSYQKYYKTGYCNQWYIVHPEKKDFKLIANINKSKRNNIPIVLSKRLFIDCTDNYLSITGEILDTIPVYKSKKYYDNRYLKHSFYKYYATKICDTNNKILGIFFWRFCEAENSKCIRIVDFFGFNEALYGCLDNFQKMLLDTDSEFIDFINLGIDDKYFEEAGFVNRNKTDVVLANYFEPFLLKNVDLNYAWYSKSDLKPLFFKGDSDQDRPNIILGVNDVQ